MSNDELKAWPEWKIEKRLGKGSFGVVYEVIRTDNGITSQAAVKVIAIPQDPSEVDSLRAEGLTEEATKTYFRGIVDDFVNEIKMMESFKGIQNIVSVEDYKVMERTDNIGWDIYIRMELLTPFNAYVREHKMTEQDVAKFGCDICTALEICAQRNIIHRDIKPENIFVNSFGFFKLGDFGIARKMEHLTNGLSQKGTYNYMAPEVFHGRHYDARVDIYSLGIVLYRLMNENRLPFLNDDAQLMNPNERKIALDRRLKGETLPPPCDASEEMAAIILAACTYDPDQRFASAKDFKNALAHIVRGEYYPFAPTLILPAKEETENETVELEDVNQTMQVRKMTTEKRETVSEKTPTNDENNKKKSKNTFGKKRTKWPWVLLLLLILIGIGGTIAYPHIMDTFSKDSVIEDKEEDKVSDSTPSPEPKPTATLTPEPTATPTPKPTATPTPKPTATSLPSPTPILSKYTVCVDAGHGDWDGGAGYYEQREDGLWYRIRNEKDDNLRMSKWFAEALEAYGVKVILTRDTDVFLTLDERTNIANEVEADALISFHRNSYDGNSDMRGVEFWIHSSKPEDARILAYDMLAAIMEVGGMQSRGVKWGSMSSTKEDYAINRESKMTSMIIELGFISSEADNEAYDAYGKQYAEEMAKAVFEWLQEK